MAHLMKCKTAAVAPMLRHYERASEGTLARENIDPERTRMNYTLGSGNSEDVTREIERCRELHDEAGRALRSDAVVLTDWVITAPRDLEPEREREFFEVSFELVRERYGHENVQVGYVHMDERTPHMHVPVIPFDRDSERFRANEIMDRKDLKSFHDDLARRVEREMGRSYQVKLDEEQRQERAGRYVDLREYKDARAETERASERLESVRREVREAETEERDSRDRNRELRREVEPAKDESREAGEEERAAQERNRELGKEVGELRGRVDGLEAARDEAERRVDRLEERNRGLERSRDELRGRVQELRGRVEGLKEQVRELRGRVGELAGRVQEMARDCRLGIAQLREKTSEALGLARVPVEERSPERLTLPQLEREFERLSIETHWYEPGEMHWASRTPEGERLRQVCDVLERRHGIDYDTAWTRCDERSVSQESQEREEGYEDDYRIRRDRDW